MINLINSVSHRIPVFVKSSTRGCDILIWLDKIRRQPNSSLGKNLSQYSPILKTSNLKGRNFLNLLNNNLLVIEPSYTKGGPWIKQFGFSNSLSLCARAITKSCSNCTPLFNDVVTLLLLLKSHDILQG